MIDEPSNFQVKKCRFLASLRFFLIKILHISNKSSTFVRKLDTNSL